MLSVGLNEVPIFVSHSEDDTFALGFSLGKSLIPSSVVSLFGDLGAGKTLFVKGIVSAATGTPPEMVQSPTFAYLNIYEGAKTIYHFDLYRLSSGEEFFQMGFDEFFYREGICCIEWVEKISEILPHHSSLNLVNVTLKHVEEGVRQITIEAKNEKMGI